MTAHPDPYTNLVATARAVAAQQWAADGTPLVPRALLLDVLALTFALRAAEAAPPAPCPECARLLGGLAILAEEADLAARRAGLLGEEDRAQDVARRALRALAHGLRTLLAENPRP